MISSLLVNTFIKNKEIVTDDKVRNSYGILGGIVGIIVNSFLFLVKLTIGLLVSSIAITADAFNNLSDAFSSIITIIGFKMANKPPDEEHPFGHGRMEYLSALIVAFLVMLVGFEFVKTSIDRILNPETISFDLIPFTLLLISILFKLWLSKFNKLIGDKINSSALKASSIDALGDVFTTTCVAISFLASRFTNFPIDGYIGTLVALFIMYSGFSLVKETINPLLGEAPDPTLVSNIKKMVLSYDHIIGVHDLIIHNYGPGKCMASIHAEVPSDISLLTIHEIIDTAERDISDSLKILLVIHMDPICMITEENLEAYDEVNTIISEHPIIRSMHDFRVVGEGDNKNLIFDIVVHTDYSKKGYSDDALKQEIISTIQQKHSGYNCIITIDKSFL